MKRHLPEKNYTTVCFHMDEFNLRWSKPVVFLVFSIKNFPAGKGFLLKLIRLLKSS